jgi:GTP-binding protein Era
MAHRAGFVNIIGNPNVGKSTLMNALTGEPLTVITPKAQTTRHRIIGIINGNDYQVVFSDTPGILNPKYKLHKALMKQVFDALGDADVFLYVIEPGEPLPENKDIIKQINVSDIPVILLINKIDNAKDETIALTKQKWDGIFNNTVFIPISALKKTNLNLVMDTIISFLPESPPY